MGFLIGLLTLAAMASIFGGTLVAWYKRPPVIQVNLVMPDSFTLIQQRLPAKIETDKPIEIPIPTEILEYINLESDSWAQDARRKRVRSLFNESNSWDYAFRQLQTEDSIE